MRATVVDATAVRRALVQRLRAAAEVALDELPAPEAEPAHEAALLLDRLVRHVRSTGSRDVAWLLLVALTASYPTDDAVRTTIRRLELDSPAEGATWLLEAALGELGRSGASLVEIDVVVGATVVDVDFSARHNLNTGIQRVVRSTVPLWVRDHDAVLVAWASFGAFRTVTETERERVVRWSGPISEPAEQTRRRDRVVVPWRSVVVLPEVPARSACDAIAALARHSGNAVTAIGYDAIPVVSADLMPPAEPNRFVHYLTIVKHARKVSGISATAAAEFRGFADMLPAQGIDGPEVTACVLPVEVPPEAWQDDVPAGSTPLVVAVGSHEPRKNHLAVLHAAERLWREGNAFTLRFIGGSSWASAEFDRQVKRLHRQGRDVHVGRAVGDADLWAALRGARFTVFPSLHEGYGLPVAESLAVGTPAVSSDYGSTAEIARDGGVLLVDPRDDEDLTEAMRRLLTDDALLADLRAQATSRPPRTWEQYAAELWEQLVESVEVAS